MERGTSMNQNFLAQPGAASVARRGAVALASALRTERRVPFGSPGQVDLGFSWILRIQNPKIILILISNCL